ncbi:hypothetical protein RRG08_050661 [Elysia crispata]|uniref:Uncharacterized protein n=1 Tax=Elysia crispata TaxID=231223 RepID=A0AAE1AE71_9GAST|nr:hypothetical protein RRG08_050661 [Elysia crispata]
MTCLLQHQLPFIVKVHASQIYSRNTCLPVKRGLATGFTSFCDLSYEFWQRDLVKSLTTELSYEVWRLE